ncbi:cholesterol esterase [Blastocladiella emersonii ATCC 22665]|nr:cholesterol esterase [Blastocladiella emersonii ATCC 22665]
MGIPVLSRLGASELVSVVVAVTILCLERVLRVVAYVIPTAVLDYVRYQALPGLPRLFSGYRDETEPNPVGKMAHIREMVQHHGFPFQEHIVDSDGYRLGIHRIPFGPLRTGPKASPSSASPRPDRANSADGTNANALAMIRRAASPLPAAAEGRPVVLLWHGFMMCSDVWVCSRTNSLAFMLVEEGYDVWLGNNRGNKYSFKHATMSAKSEEFWNFSLDEYTHDLANTVDYILQQTGQRSLVYVGFSQGTAQLFAALSCNPQLNDKIRIGCCLAPTGKPHDLRNSFITSLVKSTPSVLYLIFGRKSAIPSVLFWKNVFSPWVWVQLLDFFMHLLFNWTLSEIDFDEKLVLYRHLYSTASIKSVVHWFQIIRGGFAMFDDDPSARPWSTHALTHVPAHYPLKNITTPIALFYGAKDTLSDLPFLLASLPRPVFVLKVEDYEHLDCLWASSAHEILFPGVLGVIRHFAAVHPDGSPAPTPKSHPTISDEMVNRVIGYGIVQTPAFADDEGEDEYDEAAMLAAVQMAEGIRSTRTRKAEGGGKGGVLKLAASPAAAAKAKVKKTKKLAAANGTTSATPDSPSAKKRPARGHGQCVDADRLLRDGEDAELDVN